MTHNRFFAPAALILALFGQLLSAAPATPAANPRANGRVVTVEQVGAVVDYNPQPEVIRAMVRRGVTALAGKPDVSEAWRTFVTVKDTVGIKVFSSPGRYSGTRPAVVRAVVEQLLAAGVPARQIVIWDKHLVDLRLAGFNELATELGVRLAASSAAGWDGKYFYDSVLIGRPVYGDLEFGRTGESLGRKSYVSQLVTQDCTKLISIAPMLNHNLAGVSGHLYGLAGGSTDNFIRFDNDSARLATAVPEIFALPILGDRVVLNLTDALVAQYEGGERGLLHYSSVLNQLRFSTDPVALDVLSLGELERQRNPARPGVKAQRLELFQNAELLQIGIADEKKIRVEKVK